MRCGLLAVDSNVQGSDTSNPNAGFYNLVEGEKRGYMHSDDEHLSCGKVAPSELDPVREYVVS